MVSVCIVHLQSGMSFTATETSADTATAMPTTFAFHRRTASSFSSTRAAASLISFTTDGRASSFASVCPCQYPAPFFFVAMALSRLLLFEQVLDHLAPLVRARARELVRVPLQGAALDDVRDLRVLLLERILGDL